MSTDKPRFRPKTDRGTEKKYSPRPPRFRSESSSSEGRDKPRRPFERDGERKPSFRRDDSGERSRPRFGEDRGEGRPKFGADRAGQYAPRKTYGGDSSDRPRRPFERDGERKPFRRDEGGERSRPRFGEDRGGEYRPRKTYGGDSADRPRRSFGDSERKPFRRDEGGEGRPRKSFGGDRESFGEKKFSRGKDNIRTSHDFANKAEEFNKREDSLENDYSTEESEKSPNVIGIHAITDLLNEHPEQIQHLFLLKDSGNRRLFDLQKLADEKKIRIHQVPPRKLDTLCGSSKHQGALAICHAQDMLTWEKFLEQLDVWEATGEPVRIALPAAIEDPRNLGAIIRSALGLGVKALILPKTGGTGITPLVHKASAGASLKVPVCTMPNPETCLPELKERGYKLVGLLDREDAVFPEEFADWDKMVIVVGGEDRDIPAYIEKRCEGFCKLPMDGALHSYNASVAFSLFAYHIQHLKSAE